MATAGIACLTPPPAAHNLKIVANERFARTDTSVTGQVLKTMGANPDAVLIAGAGTPSALPAKALKERGYKGKVYQTHGVANNDFLRVCGKDCDGELLPAGPILVTDQLPDSNPVKRSRRRLIRRRMRRRTARGRYRRLAAMRGTPGICWNKPFPKRSRRLSPGHRSVSCGAAHRAGKREGPAARAWRDEHHADRSQRPRQARPRDGADCRRQVEAAERLVCDTNRACAPAIWRVSVPGY